MCVFLLDEWELFFGVTELPDAKLEAVFDKVILGQAKGALYRPFVLLILLMV
jgi:hypothetical protein